MLLFGTPSDNAKLEAWERSAKLKHAEGIVRFYGSRPDAPERVLAARQFAAKQAASIKAERTSYWGKDSHPKTWTGKNLLENVRDADKIITSLGLEEFYETFYRVICFTVHGSALAGLRTYNTWTASMASA